MANLPAGNEEPMEHGPTEPDEQIPAETEEGSPVPDPERNEDENDAEDVPTAD